MTDGPVDDADLAFDPRAVDALTEVGRSGLEETARLSLWNREMAFRR